MTPHWIFITSKVVGTPSLALQGVLALQAALEKGQGRRHRAHSLSLPLPCFLPVQRQLQSALDFWPSLRPF